MELPSRSARGRTTVTLWAGIVLAVILTLGVALAAGEESGCVAAGDCGCESLDAGVVSQQTNALTSLAFLGAAVAVMVIGPASRQPRLTATRVRILGAALGLTAMGSAVFHATITEVAGWADLVGASAVPLFVLTHRSTRRDDVAIRVFGAALASAALVAWTVGTANSRYVLTVLVGGAVAAELGSLWKRRQTRPRPPARWLATALVVLGTGAWFWALGSETSNLCRPDSVWQWHGLWHITASFALIALFFHWRSEPALSQPRVGEGAHPIEMN